MARIRNIKPGFFTNENLAEIDPLGRILFAGLWIIADRRGRLEDRPKKIKVSALPYDDCNVDELLQKLADGGFIIRYEVDGVKYIAITNWDKHQNPHVKELDSIIPAPNQHHTSPSPEQCQHHTSPSPILLDPDPDPLSLTIGPVAKSTKIEPIKKSGEIKIEKSPGGMVLAPWADEELDALDQKGQLAYLVKLFEQCYPERKKFGVGGRTKAHDEFKKALDGKIPASKIATEILFGDDGINKDPPPWRIIKTLIEHGKNETLAQSLRRAGIYDKEVGIKQYG